MKNKIINLCSSIEKTIETCKKYSLTIEQNLILNYILSLKPIFKDYAIFNTKQLIVDIPIIYKTNQEYLRSQVKDIFLKTKGVYFDYILEASDVKQIVLNIRNYKKICKKIPTWAFFNCEWCNDYILYCEEHHYPVTKKDNGSEVVKICSNCHNLFHNLMHHKNLIRIKERTL